MFPSMAGPWLSRRAELAAAVLCAAGCIGVPSPLAPAFSGSVGVPHHGVLTRGAALPDSGAGFKRLRNDGMRWAQERLVRAIERAAARVSLERPGTALVVGDLSAKSGGRIDRHRSHRTGRDADLLFFVLTPAGVAVENSGFPHFGADALAETERREQPFVRLDIERSWLLVKALVDDTDARVQRLFVARWVEALLVEHARARGEDDELVWRAAQVLRQPSDSFPHDDHLHVRIACSFEEQLAGCVDNGPRWSWQGRAESVHVPDAEILSALLEDSPATDASAESAIGEKRP